MERDASHNLSVLAQRQLRLIPILVRTLLRFVQINKGATRVAPCLIQFVNRPCFVESQHRDKPRICTDGLCKQLALLNMAEEPLGFLLHSTVCLSVLFSNARIQVVVVESFLSKSRVITKDISEPRVSSAVRFQQPLTIIQYSSCIGNGLRSANARLITAAAGAIGLSIEKGASGIHGYSQRLKIIWRHPSDRTCDVV